MALNTNEKEAKDKMQKERRSFFKKAVYAAPALIVLGQLVKPSEAQAESKISPPPPWGTQP